MDLLTAVASVTMLFDNRFIIVAIFVVDNNISHKLRNIDFHFCLQLVSTVAFSANVLFSTPYSHVLQKVTVIHPFRVLITHSIPKVKNHLFQLIFALFIATVLNVTTFRIISVYYLGFLATIFFAAFIFVPSDLVIIQFYLGLSIELLCSKNYSVFAFVNALILDSNGCPEDFTDSEKRSFIHKLSGRMTVACLSLFFGALPLESISHIEIEIIVLHAITCLTAIKFFAGQLDDRKRYQEILLRNLCRISSVMTSIASLFLVTHESWLKIGLSLTRLLICALISPILSLLYVLAK